MTVQNTKNDIVVEESVIVVLGETGEANVMVRKSPQNGGRVEFYKLSTLNFGDVKVFLTNLSEQPLLSVKQEPTKIFSGVAGEDIKAGQVMDLDETTGYFIKRKI